MEDIEKLKKLVRLATPGPWEKLEEDNGANAVVTSRSNKPVKIVTALINRKEDQNFIVAANPAAILAMIDYIERLKTEKNHADR